MGALIVRQKLTTDHWQWLDENAPIAAGGSLIISLARLLSDRDAFADRPGELGVVLHPDDDPLSLAGELKRLSLIAVTFPVFTDGRGYSSARLIRERLGWTGELRAVGDVQRDQIPYLFRVGFDAFALKAGQDPEQALSAFGDFSEAYQASVAQPLPLFRRRWAT
jgi:uncharacterized protein (DUF934 family)